LLCLNVFHIGESDFTVLTLCVKIIHNSKSHFNYRSHYAPNVFHIGESHLSFTAIM